jgi:hypothetical protein
MTLYWSKSSNIIDWLIALITGQDCAHFAYSFLVNGQQIVFETNLLGAHATFYSTWIKTSNRQIIHQIDVPSTQDEIAALWAVWAEKYDGTMYDYTGVIYTGLMTLRQRWFGIPKPKRNAWSMRNTYYCDEIYQLASGKPGFPLIDRKSNGMDSPHDVYVTVSGKVSLS